MFVGLMLSGNAFAEFKTLKCIQFGYYFNDEGTLETILWDKPEDSKKNITLLIDDNTFHDKDGTHFKGKVTLIKQDYKHEYLITAEYRNFLQGIRYFFVTDEVINPYQGRLKQYMKKKKGHLYHISFMTLEKSEFFDWHELNLMRSQDLYMIDDYWKDSVEVLKESYRCKE